MKTWGCHVYIINTDTTGTKLNNGTYIGVFMKFVSTIKIVVYYNPKTKTLFGTTLYAYFDKLNVGHKTHICTTKLVPGGNLISHFPQVPNDIPAST